MKSKISEDGLILFIGDSITDCGRDRERATPNEPASLGGGYAAFVAAQVLSEKPGGDLLFLNKGISGNRVVDLLARWRADVIRLKPDVVSILIGVNDTWHEFSSENGVEPARYEEVYRMILRYTRQSLPEVQFVLCEPFVLQVGAVTPEWLPEMAERRAIVKRLAGEFEAVHVPFQEMFNRLLAEAEAGFWLPDGVHPSSAGHQRMAAFWRRTVGL